MRRALVACAVALIGAYVAYVVGVTALLNSGVFKKLLNPKPEHVRIDWGFAYSYWPRRVEMRDFSIVGQGLEVQWELQIDQARANVELLPLLRKNFAARDVRAQGAVLRLRPTVAPLEEQLQQARAFPPITGVQDPPIRYEGPLRPPEENGWTVDLRGARFEGVRELWIGAYRAQTDGRVEGDLHTRAGWNIFFDARAQIAHGKVFIFDEPVIGDAQVQLKGAMELADLPHTIGAERLRTLRGTVQGDAEGVSLALIGQHAPESQGQVGGLGRLRLSAGFVEGLLTPGSSLSLRGDDAHFTFEDGWSVRAPKFAIDGSVSEKGALSLAVSTAPLWLKSGSETLLESPEGRLVVDAPVAQVIPPLTSVRMRVDLAPTRPAPVERFARLFAAAPVDLQSGWVTAEADGTMRRGGNASGDLRVRIEDAKGHFKDGAFEGDIELELDLRRFSPSSAVADLSGSRVRLRELTLITPEGRVDGWNATLELEDASLRTRSRRLVAKLDGSASDARPLLLLKGKKSKVDRFLTAKNLQLSANVDVSPSRLLVPRFELDGEGLNLRGGVLRDGRGTNGAMLAKVRGLPVGVTFMGKDAATSFALRDVWLQERLDATGVTEAANAAGGVAGRGTGGAASEGN